MYVSRKLVGTGFFAAMSRGLMNMECLVQRVRKVNPDTHQLRPSQLQCSTELYNRSSESMKMILQ